MSPRPPAHPGTNSAWPKLGQGAHSAWGWRVKAQKCPPHPPTAVWPPALVSTPGLCSQHLPASPTLRFLPPQERGGGMEARSGEQGEKTRWPGGLDQGSDSSNGSSQGRPGRARAAGSLVPRLQPTSAAHLFPQQASCEPSPWAALLVPRPAVAEVHWRSAAPAARALCTRGPFLPQRKQLCLSGGHAPHPSGGSGAQQWMWETEGHARQAWGPLSGSPSRPAHSRATPCLVEQVSLEREDRRLRRAGGPSRGRGLREAATPDPRPRMAQRTHGRPRPANPEGPFQEPRQAEQGTASSSPARKRRTPAPRDRRAPPWPLASSPRSPLPPERRGRADPAGL